MTKNKVILFPNTSFTQSLNCIETVALAHTGKMLENIYGKQCHSQQYRKNDTPPTMIPQGFYQCKSFRCLNNRNIEPCHEMGQLCKFEIFANEITVFSLINAHSFKCPSPVNAQYDPKNIL